MAKQANGENLESRPIDGVHIQSRAEVPHNHTQRKDSNTLAAQEQQEHEKWGRFGTRLEDLGSR
jgi:hypothetical protein